MVDDVVRSEAHSEECTGRVEMARHTRPTVHVLSQTLKQQVRTVYVQLVLVSQFIDRCVNFNIFLGHVGLKPVFFAKNA